MFMKCPHCSISFHENLENSGLGQDGHGNFWGTTICNCPSCKEKIVYLFNGRDNIWLVHPKSTLRSTVPVEVDDKVVVSDYQEACLVLSDSPKASAALSRRSLQHILREKVGVKPADLIKEIQEIIDGDMLPADLAENLDVVRNIGNFAAHPTKSSSSGEIVEVEPGEAEWNLDVLEELIDYLYVRPARTKAKKEALNEKLIDAGKQPIK